MNIHPDPKHVGAYSTESDTHYPDWDALVEAEADGYVVTAVLSKGKRTWTHSTKAVDKADAKREQARLRSSIKRMDWTDGLTLVTVTQSPLWLRPGGQKTAAVDWLHRRFRKMMPKVDGYGHLTASDEVKWEVAFLQEELERKGYDGVHHLMVSGRGLGPGPYYDKEGRVKKA